MPQQERSKLDDRSVKHVFIGYDQNSKGYKLYNPSNGKIMVSRDVEFDEEAIWDWETNEESTYDFLPYFEEDIQHQFKIQLHLLLLLYLILLLFLQKMKSLVKNHRK